MGVKRTIWIRLAFLVCGFVTLVGCTPTKRFLGDPFETAVEVKPLEVDFNDGVISGSAGNLELAEFLSEYGTWAVRDSIGTGRFAGIDATSSGIRAVRSQYIITGVIHVPRAVPPNVTNPSALTTRFVEVHLAVRDSSGKVKQADSQVPWDAMSWSRGHKMKTKRPFEKVFGEAVATAARDALGKLTNRDEPPEIQ